MKKRILSLLLALVMVLRLLPATAMAGDGDAPAESGDQGYLSELLISTDKTMNDSNKNWEIAPNFNENVYDYTVTIPSNTEPNAYLRIRLSASAPQNSTVKASYVNDLTGKETTSNIPTDDSITDGTQLSSLVRAGARQNAIKVVVGIEGQQKTYTIKIIRKFQLSSLSVAAADNTAVPLEPTYDAASNNNEYTAKLTQQTDAITVSVSAGTALFFKKTASFTIHNAAANQSSVSVPTNWDETGTLSIPVVLQANDGLTTPRTYTLKAEAWFDSIKFSSDSTGSVTYPLTSPTEAGGAYTLMLPADAEQLYVFATDKDRNAVSVKYNDLDGTQQTIPVKYAFAELPNSIEAGSYVQTLSILAGEKTHIINLESHPVLKSLDVTTAESNNNLLSTEFNVNETKYIAFIPDDAQTVTISGILPTSDCSLTIDGVAAENGTRTFAPSWNGLGVATVNMAVTRQTSRVDYNITLVREGAKLAPVVSSSCDKMYTYDQDTTPADLIVQAEAPGEIGELSYQWTQKGNPIYQATTAAYTPSTAYTPAYKTADYHCVVTNSVYGHTYTTDYPVSIIHLNLTHAQTPNIVQHPTEQKLLQNGTAATFPMPVQTNPTDGGKLSYQWYSNTSNTTEGAVALTLDGATTATFTPPADQVGTRYYYCVVTNTVENYTAQAQTNIAKIRVQSLKEYLEENNIALPWEGDGTNTQPLKLNNLDDLKKLSEFVDQGVSFENFNFVLTSDITLPASWNPIGSLKAGKAEEEKGINILPFGGIFDGANHLLSIEKGGKPLFEYVRNATVRNLNIYGEQIDSYGLVEKYTVDYGADGNYNTGCPSAIRIENVTLKAGTKTLQSGFIGGYASGANVIDIINCTAEKDVVIGYDKTQSNIGTFAGAFNGNVYNCTSYADVYGADTVGGLIGNKGQAMGPCVIANSAFLGSVTASGQRAAGILGCSYDGSGSAPNSPVSTVFNCYVDATITGADWVAGIISAEPEVIDCWSNGKGTVSDNVFYGKVVATNPDALTGGIIAYMKSLNKFQGLSNNFYLSSCGAESGIGKIERLITVDDPLYGNHGIELPFEPNKLCIPTTAEEFANGSVVQQLNNSNTSYKNWEQGPRYPVFKAEPVAYALAVSGAYKTEYFLGDALDLAGMEMTVALSDGSTQSLNWKSAGVTITGFDAAKRGVQTLTVAYGAAKAEFAVTVLKRPDSGTNTITVYFTLLGDEVHDSEKDGKVHTLRSSNLGTWISRTGYTVGLNATVKDVLDAALSANGMTCSNPSGNYVESITRDGVTLGEFTNGKNSGWMYTLNGTHPDLGVSEQFLENGDKIVWHYTDDYTKEQGSENWGGSTGTTASGSTTITQETVVSGNTATATVTEQAVTDAISSAKKNGDTAITIVPTDTGSAKSVSVTLPKAAAQNIVDDTNVSLVVETNGGNVTIPNDTLKSIASQASGSSITITVEQKTASDVTNKNIDTTDAVVVAVTVASNGKSITSFGGKALTITIPVNSKFTEGQSYKVIEVSADGTTKTLTGKCVKVDGKLCVQVSATGLSTFVVTTQKAMPFTDVSGHWALEGIQYAYDNGLFAGTSDTTFSPDTAMTRAMLVTVLYRMEGSPAVTGTSSFNDVKAGQYYTDAVIWANANGIVGGYGNGQFGTNDSITREQLAAILYRYAQYKKYELTGSAVTASAYPDYEQVNAYAKAAMDWAVASQLLQGCDGKLMSNGTATRAQVATILMRFAENVAK